MQNGVFARFGYAFDPKNTAKPSENVVKPFILLCFCLFFFDFPVFAASGALRAAPGRPRGSRGASPNWELPGALLGPPESSWSAPGAPRGTEGTPGGASGSLLALSWSFLEPRDLILQSFFPPERLFVLAFCATATETATASWSLALEALDQGSWALALESWALARGSLALARGSWALALGS